MTKAFSMIVTARAITASLAAVTPVSAFATTDDIARIAGGDLRSGR